MAFAVGRHFVEETRRRTEEKVSSVWERGAGESRKRVERNFTNSRDMRIGSWRGHPEKKERKRRESLLKLDS